MELIIRYQIRDIKLCGQNIYVFDFFKTLINKLINVYPQHNFSVLHDEKFEQYGYGSIHSCMNLSILNPITEEYILISFFDNWRYHFMKCLGWKPNKMKQFFYSGGFNYLDFYNFKQISQNNLDIEIPKNFEKIYNQFYYIPYLNAEKSEINNIFNLNPNKKRQLFFRGWMWDFRKEMTKNLNSDDIIIFDKNENNQNISFIEYLKELKTYKAALSLPGGTEICHRDIECFSIGVPVIRPNLLINYPEPLIPNYHYINCYHSCDYSDFGHPKYVSNDDFKKNLEYTWGLVKNNDEFLNFISNNAKNWYDSNCEFSKNLEFIFNKINLDLIVN